jgi:hypothetical protein
MTVEDTLQLSKEYRKDLAALRERYPMCYLESWTPDEFDAVAEREDSVLADWFDPKHLQTAENLLRSFDPMEGTNWETIDHAQA